MTGNKRFLKLKQIDTVIATVSAPLLLKSSVCVLVKLLIFVFLKIRRLLSGMVCAQDGQLETGDKLVSVNGVSLKGVTHSMALQLLKKPMDVVTFVILREGLQTRGKVTRSSLNPSIAQTPAQNSTKLPDREELAKTLPSKTESVDKPLGVGQPVTDSESRDLLDTSHESPLAKKEETAQEEVPEIPCSPPPSPVLGVDDLLDDDLSIAPSSFSPPPPPLTSDLTPSNDDDLLLSSIPRVSPPPDLSPRMKEFLEQDVLNGEDDHETNSRELIHQEESLQESSATLNPASSPRNDTVVGWDFESLLDACNDLNSNESDDVLTFEHGNVTETPLAPGDSKPKRSSPELSQISKKSDFEKLTVVPVESSTDIQSLAMRGDNDVLSTRIKNEITLHGLADKDKGLQAIVKDRDVTEELTSLAPPVSPLYSESEASDSVKPVAGRRVENVPFVITYQKKFRSLGIKVDLSGEGKVIVTEVSSFGLVGKDGNIRYELHKPKSRYSRVN